MKKVKNFLFITVPVFIVCIILMEVILRKWLPVDDPFERFKERYANIYIPSQHPPYASYNFSSNEGLSGIDKNWKFSINNIGFRGNHLEIVKPADELRIFMIGGSTTQCMALDDSKSIDQIVQQELQKKYPGRVVKVYNAGKSGDTSPDHLAMLSQKIIHLQPDMIILFSGFNDLRLSVRNYDYAHLAPYKVYSPKYIFLIATNFQIGRRLYYLFKQKTIEEIRESIPLETNFRKLYAWYKSAPISDSLPLINARPYSINLNSIAGICFQNNVKLVFMTNQSTWNSKIDPRTRDYHYLPTMGKITYKEEYLDQGLDLFNDTMRNIALRKSIPLLDIAKLVPKSLDYFYDDCHFNIKGAQYAGEELAELIVMGNFIDIEGR